MNDTMPIAAELWPWKRAAMLASVLLLIGIAGGWFIRGWQNPIVATPAKPSAAVAAQAPSAASDPAQLKQAADADAATLLEQLKADPQNAGLLTSVGNLYYDAQQYATAIDYYGRALEKSPEDANVRTDLGTAYWYLGKADAAISEFDKALTYAPANSNTLFNRGLVRWQGKRDAAGALADWQKLLATNPKYEAREKVEQMIAEVKSKSAGGN